MTARGVVGFSLIAGAAIFRSFKTRASLPKAFVVERGHPLPKSDELISIVSYNVLCDAFATPEKFPSVPRQEVRWGLLKNELASFDADIICIQEAHVDERWQEMKQFMADLGYDCIVQQKPHEVKLAVFWRCSRLRALWSEERSRALLVEMGGDLHSQKPPLFVINVHLEASPTRAADRVAQLRKMLHRLEYHLESTGRDVATARILLCGDFNSVDGESACTFIREGRLAAGATDSQPQGLLSTMMFGNDEGASVTDHDIDHPFQLIDVYKAANAVPEYTRRLKGQKGARLDFIWTSPSLLPVEAVLRPVPVELAELIDVEGLPNYAMPSDHLPVGAVLRWV